MDGISPTTACIRWNRVNTGRTGISRQRGTNAILWTKYHSFQRFFFENKMPTKYKVFLAYWVKMYFGNKKSASKRDSKEYTLCMILVRLRSQQIMCSLNIHRQFKSKHNQGSRQIQIISPHNYLTWTSISCTGGYLLNGWSPFYIDFMVYLEVQK